MRTGYFLLLFLASMAVADSGSDRTAIQTVISELNDHGRQVSTLFASGADQAELNKLAKLVGPNTEPLSEVTAPKITVRSIRFITPDVAVADAASAQYGSVSVKTAIPLLFIMKKEQNNWRIASFRILINLPDMPVPR